MHRLFVHRGFRTGPIMRVFFCAIAQMAIQGRSRNGSPTTAAIISMPMTSAIPTARNSTASEMAMSARSRASCRPGRAGCSTRPPPKTNTTQGTCWPNPIAMFFVPHAMGLVGIDRAVFSSGVIGNISRRHVRHDGFYVLSPACFHQPVRSSASQSRRLKSVPGLRLPPLRGGRRLDQRVRDHDPHLRRGSARPSPLARRKLYISHAWWEIEYQRPGSRASRRSVSSTTSSTPRT